MEEFVWRIFWNDFAKDTFTYGSEIVFHAKNDIEFKNELMSPGTVIKEWKSKTVYQIERVEPSLPMIDGEGKYHIRLYVSEEGYNKLLLKIVFYDRYDIEIGSTIIRDGEIDFVCPIRTFSYKIQLINSGAEHFHFYFLEMTEITNE